MGLLFYGCSLTNCSTRSRSWSRTRRTAARRSSAWAGLCGSHGCRQMAPGKTGTVSAGCRPDQRSTGGKGGAGRRADRPAPGAAGRPDRGRRWRGRPTGRHGGRAGGRSGIHGVRAPGEYPGDREGAWFELHDRVRRDRRVVQLFLGDRLARQSARLRPAGGGVENRTRVRSSVPQGSCERRHGFHHASTAPLRPEP